MTTRKTSRSPHTPFPFPDFITGAWGKNMMHIWWRVWKGGIKVPMLTFLTLDMSMWKRGVGKGWSVWDKKAGEYRKIRHWPFWCWWFCPPWGPVFLDWSHLQHQLLLVMHHLHLALRRRKWTCHSSNVIWCIQSIVPTKVKFDLWSNKI